MIKCAYKTTIKPISTVIDFSRSDSNNNLHNEYSVFTQRDVVQFNIAILFPSITDKESLGFDVDLNVIVRLKYINYKNCSFFRYLFS